MKSFLSFVLILLVISCAQQQETKTVAVTPQQIEAAISNGSFNRAEALIREYIHANPLPFKEQQRLLFQIDKMNRIRMDFSATDSSVLSFIHNYYDSVSPQQIRIWEEGRALEYKIIDGQKRYFNHAARNLFRISGTARRQWERINGTKPDSLNRFLAQYIPFVVNEVQKEQKFMVDPVGMEVTFTLTVRPNAVPSGELVRVWMPMPRTDIPRQTQVSLISTSQPNFVVSPDYFAHKTIYMEKRAIVDEPTIFSYTFSYTSYAEWYDFNPADLKLYNTQSDIYQNYTVEQPPHIIFSDRIKSITDEVVGNEQNPYLKVRKIYDWIDKNFPWASAREYSTIDNIPEYVLDNRHGDCGQVSLLFITMARCAGIPAKWQSGWMMHPGNKNLHDWAEVYYEGIGWVPVDQSFGRVRSSQNPNVFWYYTKGIDAFRLVVNQDTGRELYPFKMYPRSETVDFQRGEVEWRGGNLYFNQWHYNMDIVYKPAADLLTSESAEKERERHTQVSPFTESGYSTFDNGRAPFSGTYPFPIGSQPSYYQHYGRDVEEANTIFNQRSYLRNPQRDNSAPNDPYLYDSYGTTPYRYDSYQYNNSNSSNTRIEDNSISPDYNNLNRIRTEDRYVPPSERVPFPGSSSPQPYRRDLREE